jgi:hypothetical protein
MPTKPTTPAISADEARRIAAEYNTSPPAIQPWLDRIHELIRQEASEGETSIMDLFGALGCPPPSMKELEAISAVLVSEGYGVVWLERMPPILEISWG